MLGMSALGHKQTSRPQFAMSARKRTFAHAIRMSALGQQQTFRRLWDTIDNVPGKALKLAGY